MQNKQKQDRDLFKCLRKLIKIAYGYSASIVKQICGKCNIEDANSNDNLSNVKADIDPINASNETSHKITPEEAKSESAISSRNTAKANSTPKPTKKRKLITKKIKKPTRKNSVKKLSIKK
jgi:hypothetical protein